MIEGLLKNGAWAIQEAILGRLSFLNACGEEISPAASSVEASGGPSVSLPTPFLESHFSAASR